MILENGHSDKYLQDYKNGLIPQGLELGIYLDDYLRFKRGQLNFILGHDNVGKSYWVLWYFLALAVKHDLKFTLFMDENSVQTIMRDLVRMYLGKKIQDSSDKELAIAITKIENHFSFVSNLQRYTPEELLEIFKSKKSDAYLIDPFNGLKTALSYSSNYDVLNDLKMFCKQNNATIYINAHPSTASGRRQANYEKGHTWEGHVTPPMKDDIEGGKSFSNKADDFIIIHRLISHETMNTTTLVDIRKVKDTDSGGKQTILNQSIYFDFNYGNGFKCGGIDPIVRPFEKKNYVQEQIKYEPVNLTKIGMEVNHYYEPKTVEDDDMPF